ncbi:MAG: ABC transporter ATP-binding protein [Candidatus Micrarchaeota archaeon]|nr:ABC transporter ATP-binding protein [Candidatus Micrarchaeota archaeon]
MADSVLKLDGVSKLYDGATPFLALDRISLDIRSGELLAIVGPSGSGKSTLLHLLGCLDRPTAGEIYLDGKAISKMSDDEVADIRRDTIGFVFQAFNLAPTLTVFKNVELPLMIRGMPKPERHERTMRNLETVGLIDKKDSMPSQLSGGQKQRVAIARALANDPKIILADEPTGNLDSVTSEEIINSMLALRKDHGITVILVTHDAGLADRTDRIVRIKDGRIEKDSANKSDRRRS